ASGTAAGINAGLQLAVQAGALAQTAQALQYASAFAGGAGALYSAGAQYDAHGNYTGWKFDGNQGALSALGYALNGAIPGEGNWYNDGLLGSGFGLTGDAKALASSFTTTAANTFIQEYKFTHGHRNNYLNLTAAGPEALGNLVALAMNSAPVRSTIEESILTLAERYSPTGREGSAAVLLAAVASGGRRREDGSVDTSGLQGDLARRIRLAYGAGGIFGKKSDANGRRARAFEDAVKAELSRPGGMTPEGLEATLSRLGLEPQQLFTSDVNAGMRYLQNWRPPAPVVAPSPGQAGFIGPLSANQAVAYGAGELRMQAAVQLAQRATDAHFNGAGRRLHETEYFREQLASLVGERDADRFLTTRSAEGNRAVSDGFAGSWATYPGRFVGDILDNPFLSGPIYPLLGVGDRVRGWINGALGVDDVLPSDRDAYDARRLGYGDDAAALVGQRAGYTSRNLNLGAFGGRATQFIAEIAAGMGFESIVARLGSAAPRLARAAANEAAAAAAAEHSAGPIRGLLNRLSDRVVGSSDDFARAMFGEARLDGRAVEAARAANSATRPFGRGPAFDLHSEQGVVNAINHNADVATALTRRALSRGRINSGASPFGTRAHSYFEKLNNRLNRRMVDSGSSFRLRAEVFRDAMGRDVSRRAAGSIGADALLLNTRDSTFKRVFDLKTYGTTQYPISGSRQQLFWKRFQAFAEEIYRRR
ncbi:MAG: hypothetical protein K1X75_18005, partial [Leptospirales bacterium]|nr:hypothetical protein [Leptospirales bacterium]